MKHQETCNHCVDNDGKPQINCAIRDTCYDDASTTTRRKQTITPWSEMTE